MRITIVIFFLLGFSHAIANEYGSIPISEILDKHAKNIASLYCSDQSFDFRFFYLGDGQACEPDVEKMVRDCFAPQLQRAYQDGVKSREQEESLVISLAECVSTKQITDFRAAKCPELPAPATDDELAKVQKPIEQVTGSFWTKKYDCRYLQPLKEYTLINKQNCENAKHNYKVVTSGCPFFRSQDTFHDGPIWCLVKNHSPRNIGTLGVNVGIYCKNNE